MHAIGKIRSIYTLLADSCNAYNFPFSYAAQFTLQNQKHEVHAYKAMNMVVVTL